MFTLCSFPAQFNQNRYQAMATKRRLEADDRPHADRAWPFSDTVRWLARIGAAAGYKRQSQTTRSKEIKTRQQEQDATTALIQELHSQPLSVLSTSKTLLWLQNWPRKCWKHRKRLAKLLHTWFANDLKQNTAASIRLGTGCIYYISIHLFIYLSIYLPSYPSIHLSS